MKTELDLLKSLQRLRFILSLHPADMGEIVEDELDSYLIGLYKTKDGNAPNVSYLRKARLSIKAKQEMLKYAVNEFALRLEMSAIQKREIFTFLQLRDESLETRLQREQDQSEFSVS